MQTFLPYPTFDHSAAVLDDRRLGKQRVEALQVLRALHLDNYGWARHPVVLMWRGYTLALVAYGLAVTDAWTRRGGADTTRAMVAEFAAPGRPLDQDDLPPDEVPSWLGRRALHRSHRSALVRKDPAFYGPLFPRTPPDLPYTWPGPTRPPPPRPPRSAWIVRTADAEQCTAFRDLGLVGVPASLADASATRKQRRQMGAFLEDIAAGDRVAVPDAGGKALLAGEVIGPATPPPAAGPVAGLAAMRAVRWDATIPRARLCRPYQLQDPQTVFALYGEPAVDG